MQPWCTPFPIWSQFVVPCSVITVASWPAYRFLRRQVRWLVFPSLWKFSTIYCNPHSQRLWHSCSSRSRCFPGTLLLFQWSSGCWQVGRHKELWRKAAEFSGELNFRSMLYMKVGPGVSPVISQRVLWGPCKDPVFRGGTGNSTRPLGKQI